MSTNEELHPEPALGAIFTEQVRAVGVGARRDLIAFIALLFALGILLLWDLEGGRMDLLPGTIGPFLILAALVPLGIWRAENPERRTYLWSAPLSRRSGHMLRLVSGWLWTMLGVGLFVLWGLVMALVTDGLIWKRELSIERGDLAPDAAFEIVGGIALYTYQLPAWLVLVPFAIATILYLVGSIIVLSTNHTLRWAVVLVVVGFGVKGLADIGEAAERREFRESMGRQPTYEEIADEDRFLERLLGNQAPYGLGNLTDPEASRREIIPGTNKPVSIRRADFGNWLSATALWGGLALLAAYIAASRHRDP